MASTNAREWTRRRVLTGGLGGGALLLLGGSGFLAARSGPLEPLPAGGLKVLDARQYSVVVALARRLAAPAPGGPPPDALAIAARCDEILSHADPSAQVELQQLLGLLENALAGFLLGGRTQAFTALGAEAQDAVLDEWRDSWLTLRRTGWLALRSLVLAAHWQLPATQALAGYPGPPPDIFDPQAPVWLGGDVPRPVGNGTWVEPQAPVQGPP